MYETLLTQTNARGVTTVTLSRPDKRNALSGQMIDEMTQEAARIAGDDAVRVVILQGAAQQFCAGGDLNWMKAQIEADAATRAAEAGKLAAMLGAWNSLPKPVIARIEGAVMGGGVGLACVCDVAIAAPDCKFGLTETRLGLLPATIGPYVLARMGEGSARQVFMSARIFGSEEACRLGIVSKVTDNLDKAVEDEVIPYLACAPGAVAEAKSLALKLGGAPGPKEVEASIQALVARWETDEAAEGVAAFLEKRQANWSRT